MEAQPEFLLLDGPSDVRCIIHSHHHPFAQYPRSPRNRDQRDRSILRIEQAGELGGAGFDFLCQRLLGLASFLHGLLKLPGNYSLPGYGFGLSADALLFEEGGEA